MILKLNLKKQKKAQVFVEYFLIMLALSVLTLLTADNLSSLMRDLNDPLNGSMKRFGDWAHLEMQAQ